MEDFRKLQVQEELNARPDSTSKAKSYLSYKQEAVEENNNRIFNRNQRSDDPRA